MTDRAAQIKITKLMHPKFFAAKDLGDSVGNASDRVRVGPIVGVACTKLVIVTVAVFPFSIGEELLCNSIGSSFLCGVLSFFG